ncbi:probable tRNA(His) guanylyltransferase [Leptopilina heterotoma]|uniref:probable tRNA(His) guanylyltransferase n=1 Tax=Leptopilina heterotoma TaxID=63436 RepID=UPI001CA8FB85|nr:probable tRNA(His) guanylyltransferase [Leptopilina heterotoma]
MKKCFINNYRLLFRCFSLKSSLFSQKMAQSKFEYVKGFERDEHCLPNCYIVVRIDGRGFSKFADDHKFSKPNDLTALELMNQAAISVMENFKEIVIAYGQSDEYSFVFRRNAEQFNRRVFKITSNVNSLFASSYVFHWSQFFKDTQLLYPPAFDARLVLYPMDNNLRDYLSWRQADVHINNLHNTCFWNLVQKKNMTTREANEKLKGTVSSDKNEMLFHDFGINYNNELPIFRKGTIILRKSITENGRKRNVIEKISDDLIGDRFWIENKEVFGDNYAEELLKTGQKEIRGKKSKTKEVEKKEKKSEGNDAAISSN